MALRVGCSPRAISLSGSATSGLDSGTTRISPAMFCDRAGTIHTRTLAVTSKTKILREHSFGIVVPPLEAAWSGAGEFLWSSELRAHRHEAVAEFCYGSWRASKSSKFF